MNVAQIIALENGNSCNWLLQNDTVVILKVNNPAMSFIRRFFSAVEMMCTEINVKKQL